MLKMHNARICAYMCKFGGLIHVSRTHTRHTHKYHSKIPTRLPGSCHGEPPCPQRPHR